MPLNATTKSLRQHQGQLTLPLLVLVLMSGWCAALGYVLWQQYHTTLDNGALRADIRSRGSEEHLTQSLRMLELMAGSLRPGPAWAQDTHDLTQRLTDTVRSAPFLRSISILNTQGQVLVSSNTSNLGTVVDTAAFYPATRPEADIVRIGLPWHGRDIADGTPLASKNHHAADESSFVPVLRKLHGNAPDLWLLAVLNPDYFVLHATELASQFSTTQWLRYDGVLLFSTNPQDHPGALDAAGPVIQQLEQTSQGLLTQQLPSGQEVMTAYRASNQFPVLTAIHIERSGILEPWWADVRHLLLTVVPILLALTVSIAIAWQRRRALIRRKALQDEEHRLAASVFQSSRDAIAITDGQGKILSINTAFERSMGYASNDILGQPIPRLLDPSCDTSTIKHIKNALRSESHWRGELPCRTRDGHRFTALVTINAVHDTTLNLCQCTCTIVDVTQERAAEQQLKLAASVFSHAREGILITTANGTLIDVNEAFTHITGYTRQEVIGQHTRLLNSGRQSKEFYQTMWTTLLQNGHWTGELWNRRKSGEVYAQLSTMSAVYNDQGQVIRYVALISDISQQKENEHRLQHVAHYDALTGLPNRVLLGDRLRQAMTQAQRRNSKLALVFLDLDGFKTINDTHGHNVGDKLLIGLANRMQKALREGDTLSRIGGDEFVAVLLDLSDHESCVPVLDRLRLAAAQPIMTDGLSLQVSASLGVAFYPQSDAVEADQLLRQADQAMYQAKLSGKNRFHIFDTVQDQDIRDRNANLEDLRHALSRQEFRLHYQPKVNMRTGTVLGAEALIRWQHPNLGLLPPARFLPALQDHPLALEVGLWVLEAAMLQIETWHTAGLHVPVSVNVDAQQLQQADFVDTLREMLLRHPGVSHGDLELEVLETSALDDMDRVSKVIDKCRSLGVAFALDDFGTGYSSLTYLRHLPTRQLKIDQSFVRNMLDDPDDLAILDGVIGLAAAFRREVIAEGVETTEHGQLLLRLGCEWAQGYAIAKPMPAEAFAQWAATWQPPQVWRETPRTRREELPLLFAAVEHRAWIAAVSAYLLGQRECPPSLDPRTCRLGHWIEHEGGRKRHGAKLHFSALETLHLDIHRLAGELIQDMAQHGQNPDWVQQSIEQLHHARDTLLERLLALQ